MLAHKLIFERLYVQLKVLPLSPVCPTIIETKLNIMP
jgi:hypothetical protein